MVVVLHSMLLQSKRLGKALSNLLNSYNGNFDYSENIQIIINAILANPKFIGGSNNLDSNLIKISNKNIFCKGGAEGVFLFVHLKKEIFGILKSKRWKWESLTLRNV